MKNVLISDRKDVILRTSLFLNVFIIPFCCLQAFNKSKYYSNMFKHQHKLSTEFIDFIPKGCISCWKCVEACPKNVIGKIEVLFHRHAILVDADACIGCKKCVKACPQHCFCLLYTSPSPRDP